MEDSLTPSPDLSDYVREFEESEQATDEARTKAERDRDYFDGKQWTAAETSALQKRKQPVITYNRIQRKVNALLGLEKQTRKDPKAFPRNPDDEDAAQAATDALRYVMDDCRWDEKRSEAASNLIIEGTCAILVGAKQSRQGIDPEIVRIPWNRLYYDPHSYEFDFSDAQYMGIVIWMDFEAAKRKWPERVEFLEATMAQGKQSETYDDTPKYRIWADYKRKRVRICEHYCLKGGVWHRAVFTRAGFLEDPTPSPYQDEEGQPENPIKAVSLYVDRDNNRYGEVRMLIGPQDEINKRRSKALHLMMQRQIRVSRAAGVDKEAARRELARPDGVLFAEAGEVEILQNSDMLRANFEMLQEAKNEIDLMGPNAALAGKNEAAMSGRAILAQQQGGMLEAATILDRIRSLSMMVYRSTWARVRQFWTGERWVRVTDDERNMRFVGLNKPITAIEAMAKDMGVTPDNFAEFAQQAPEDAARLQMFARMPEARQVVGTENAVAELDVDIVVDEGIDTPTIAAEQFDQMVKMAGAGLPIPPDVLIEASSLRNKSRLLEMLAQQRQADPMAEQMKQVQMAGAVAQVEKVQSETVKNLATAEKTAVDGAVAYHSPLPAPAMPQAAAA